jgi:hypothetical protein
MENRNTPEWTISTPDGFEEWARKMDFNSETECAAVIILSKTPEGSSKPRVYTCNGFGGELHHLQFMLHLVTAQPAVQQIVSQFHQAMMAQEVVNDSRKPSILVPFPKLI